MELLVILAIAVSLSMDAFAVALATGASGQSRTRDALRIGGSFGLFQMLMPILGWMLGLQLKDTIMAFDHWVVFILLAGIGAKMIHEALTNEECDRAVGPMSIRRLLVLSVATSLDALAVGISFAFLEKAIFWPSVIIGGVAFCFATAGVLLGRLLCCVWGKRAEMLGGIILILIGVKILIDHLR